MLQMMALQTNLVLIITTIGLLTQSGLETSITYSTVHDHKCIIYYATSRCDLGEIGYYDIYTLRLASTSFFYSREDNIAISFMNGN